MSCRWLPLDWDLHEDGPNEVMLVEGLEFLDDMLLEDDVDKTLLVTTQEAEDGEGWDRWEEKPNPLMCLGIVSDDVKLLLEDSPK